MEIGKIDCHNWLKNYKFLERKILRFQKRLRPFKPSAAEAVAEGKKPSSTAVDLQPSVDLCPELLKLTRVLCGIKLTNSKKQIQKKK